MPDTLSKIDTVLFDTLISALKLIEQFQYVSETSVIVNPAQLVELQILITTLQNYRNNYYNLYEKLLQDTPSIIKTLTT